MLQNLYKVSTVETERVLLLRCWTQPFRRIGDTGGRPPDDDSLVLFRVLRSSPDSSVAALALVSDTKPLELGSAGEAWDCEPGCRLASEPVEGALRAVAGRVEGLFDGNLREVDRSCRVSLI